MEETRSFIQALEQVDLDRLTLRLDLYTHRRLARMFWRGETNGPIPGGWEPKDFVQAAFNKALAGVRVWKSSNGSVFDFLKDIISSDISNLATKSENRNEYRVPEAESEAATAGFVSARELKGSRAEWPDTDSSHDDELHHLLARAGENELDQKVVKCVLEQGISVSGAIASELKVPVSEIYKSKKRLRRRFQYLTIMSRTEPTASVQLRNSINGEKQDANT